MMLTPKPLSGTLEAPPSKSAAHRALIAAMLAEGQSVISNLVLSEDINATLGAVAALGARVTESPDGSGRLSVTVEGGRARPPEAVVACGESGSTLRFMVPVALVLGGVTEFTGTGRLPQRPMDPYFGIFDRAGILYRIPPGASLPLRVDGRLGAGEYRLPGNVSSQFITGLMLALPLAAGDSGITVEGPLESEGYIRLTRSILARFGVDIAPADGEGRFRIPGGRFCRPAQYAVEGDWTQAALWLTAGVLGGDIRVTGLEMNSAQGDRVIVDILRELGGDIARDGGGLRVRRSELRGGDVDIRQCPDLAPAVAAALALSRDGGRITGAGRLRIKESDRMASIAGAIRTLGGKVRMEDDTLFIGGAPTLRGGTVDACGDHRIAMLAACLSVRCREPVHLTGARTVNKSYPGFWDDMARLGGEWT